MSQSRLRLLLRELDEGLYHRFHAVEGELKKLLEYSQGGAHLTFTPHGISHVTRLEAAYDWLLGPEDATAFNATEIFVLLLATYTHDILMIPRRPGDETRAREAHASTVGEFLARNSQIQLSNHEARAVGETVRGHHVESISDIPEEIVLGTRIVDLRKLAACLSMADICDADERRAPRIVMEHISLDETSRWHWRRHLQISGIARRGTELVMSAFCYSDDGEKAVEDYRDAIEHQLKIIEPYFDKTLTAITGVRLISDRQHSPVDTPLSFTADVPAVLRLLIEGVYQRDDVFIRELIQNALDATYLAQAAHFKRNAAYVPQIVVTALLDKDSRLQAVRVDDDGIGMSIREIRDSLLTIAATQASSRQVQELLAETGKNLIATFGIGLLSCLKVGLQVTVSTARDGDQPVEVALESVQGEIRPKPGSDPSPGTTCIVDVRPDADIDVFDALSHYCIQIRQASLYYREVRDDAEFRSFSRKHVFAMASAGDLEMVEALDPDTEETYSCQISGDGYEGWLWLDESSSRNSIRQLLVGELTLLNDGLLIATERSDSWLTTELSLLSGVINFRAGAVQLSASRDAVRRDSTFEMRQKEISARARSIIAFLASRTEDRPKFELPSAAGVQGRFTLDSRKTDLAVLALSSIYDKLKGDDGARSTWILRDIDDYVVNLFDGSQRSLTSLLSTEKTLYITYGSGSTVDYLATFNGQRLFYEPDVEVGLEARLLVNRGGIVIHADNFSTSPRLNELTLIADYFGHHSRNVIDVVKTNPMESEIRSKGVSRVARALLGSDVKFVHLDALHYQRAWRVGDETWLNTANDQIAALYRLMSRPEISERQLQLARPLVLLLGAEFEKAVDELLDQMLGGDTTS